MAILSTESGIIRSEHAGLAVYRIGIGEPLLLMPIRYTASSLGRRSRGRWPRCWPRSAAW